MYNSSSESDNELAEMTDRLLAGFDTEVSARNQREARIVRRLHRMFSSDPSPDALFRARLTRRLSDEWDRVYRPRSWHVFMRPAVRVAVVAASLVVVFGVALVALFTTDAGGRAMTGTAVGSLATAIPAILIVVLVVLGLVLWARRH